MSANWTGPDCATVVRASTTELFICAILVCLVFFVGIVGNIIYMIVSRNNNRFRVYLLKNCVIINILILIITPVYSVFKIVFYYWPLAGWMCKVVNFFQAFSMLLCAYSLVAISADHYSSIARPLRWQVSRWAAWRVVGTVWLAAAASASPVAIVSGLHQPAPWYTACKRSVCSEVWGAAGQYTWPLLALLVALQFALPLAALVGTYARVAGAMRLGSPLPPPPPGETQHNEDLLRLRRSRTVITKTMTAVVVVFIICWLPYHVFAVLRTLYEKDEEFQGWGGIRHLWFASLLLAQAYACCGPAVYIYSTAQYRRKLQRRCQRVCGCCGCVSPETNRTVQRANDLAEYIPMSGLDVGQRGRAPRCYVFHPGRPPTSPARRQPVQETRI